MSALNSPIDLAQLLRQGPLNVVYPDDPNAPGRGSQGFFYGSPFNGVFADFAPRIDGDSPRALDNILRLLFRTNKFHIKVMFHGIETRFTASNYTDSPPIPYTWEDDLVYHSGVPGSDEANCYQSACATYQGGIQRSNNTPTPGSAYVGPADSPDDQYSSLSLSLFVNGAPKNNNFPLFMSFDLRCYPVAVNPYGGSNGSLYVQSAGDLTIAGYTPNAITLAGQTYGACSLGCVVLPPGGDTSKSQNMSFDSLEITETGSWSWDRLYD